jgi:hypothetical protein
MVALGEYGGSSTDRRGTAMTASPERRDAHSSIEIRANMANHDRDKISKEIK